MTSLDSKREPSARYLLPALSVEVTIKELKSGLHLGQLQVSKEKERVNRAIRLPVMAYLLLLRLPGKEPDAEEGFTIFQLKQRFCEETWQE